MRTLKEGTFDHEYYYEGTRLVMETVDGVKLIYLYDESGNVEAIRYNNASYYLIRNILGDVVQLRNAQNELIANYSYNAYGLPLSITNASGAEITNEAHIALINPIRYRGYYYDNETGLYYLESRYYDPELCRFISADALLIASPIGVNLYAYCGNDPVNFVDPHGFLACGIGSSSPCSCCLNEENDGCYCTRFPCAYEYYESEEEEEDPSDPIDIPEPGFTLPGVPVGGGGGRVTSTSSGTSKTSSNVKISPPSNKVHGNSLKTTKTTYGYALVKNGTNELLKYGETTKGVQRYTKKFYEENEVSMLIMTSGTKYDMHFWQHDRIVEYYNLNGYRPPLNKSFW